MGFHMVLGFFYTYKSRHDALQLYEDLLGH